MLIEFLSNDRNSFNKSTFSSDNLYYIDWTSQVVQVERHHVLEVVTVSHDQLTKRIINIDSCDVAVFDIYVILCWVGVQHNLRGVYFVEEICGQFNKVRHNSARIATTDSQYTFFWGCRPYQAFVVVRCNLPFIVVYFPIIIPIFFNFTDCIKVASRSKVSWHQ